MSPLPPRNGETHKPLKRTRCFSLCCRAYSPRGRPPNLISAIRACRRHAFIICRHTAIAMFPELYRPFPELYRPFPESSPSPRENDRCGYSHNPNSAEEDASGGCFPKEGIAEGRFSALGRIVNALNGPVRDLFEGEYECGVAWRLSAISI